MTINNIKYAVAVGVFVAIMLSGIAFAAPQETSSDKNTHQQPYITASSGATVQAYQSESLKIVQDTFLAALQTPIRPQATDRVPRVTSRVMYVDSTGYNSEEQQTDSSPFIAADGTHVYWGMVAANFLPFGTKIRIPDYYGDQVFIVHDRMNKRYWERVDVWFAQKPDAIQWGKRTIRIEILG